MKQYLGLDPQKCSAFHINGIAWSCSTPSKAFFIRPGFLVFYSFIGRSWYFSRMYSYSQAFSFLFSQLKHLNSKHLLSNTTILAFSKLYLICCAESHWKVGNFQSEAYLIFLSSLTASVSQVVLGLAINSNLLTQKSAIQQNSHQ